MAGFVGDQADLRQPVAASARQVHIQQVIKDEGLSVDEGGGATPEPVWAVRRLRDDDQELVATDVAVVVEVVGRKSNDDAAATSASVCI